MSGGPFRFTASADDAGARLDVFLAARLDRSRSALQKLLRTGAIVINGAPARAGHRIVEGDEIQGCLPEQEDEAPRPEDIPLEILFEDERVVAFNKPAGMPAHPSRQERSGTVVNALIWRYRGREIFRQDSEPSMSGLVHRLDRDTSGAMVAALDPEAGASLQKQFRDRLVEKEYIAVVHGVVEFDEGEVSVPIGKDPKRFNRKIADPVSGKAAETLYRVIERFESFSLVRLKPRTGRTHQIRVHMQHLGHAVAGDRLYPPKSRPPAPAFARQALHASSLAFLHPSDMRKVAVKAPLPADMKEFIASLKPGRGRRAGG